MWIAENWKDYEILDTSNGEKLEKWGDYILVRPDPQILWNTGHSHPLWKQKNGHYHRSRAGGGSWEFFNLPNTWSIGYDLPSAKIKFNLKPFTFKHTGVFPEQAANWDWSYNLIKNKTENKESVKVLNLFAYTGGATLSAAAAGGEVTHVDASKGMVGWAKENAVSSNLSNAPIRWLVDDCIKFVQREIRRGNHYDAIIMDPPSYGRGPKGEIWKIEDSIYEFIKLTVQLLSKEPLFFLINSYTTGLAPGILDFMLMKALEENRLPKGNIDAMEIGLRVNNTDYILPCGAGARCTW